MTNQPTQETSRGETGTMSQLPTRSEIFTNCDAALRDASSALSDARDWLKSDWTPDGVNLSAAAADARQSILLAIGEAKVLIEAMRRDAAAAVESHT
jgi:hypothetical protein